MPPFTQSYFPFSRDHRFRPYVQSYSQTDISIFTYHGSVLSSGITHNDLLHNETTKELPQNTLRSYVVRKRLLTTRTIATGSGSLDRYRSITTPHDVSSIHVTRRNHPFNVLFL